MRGTMLKLYVIISFNLHNKPQRPLVLIRKVIILLYLVFCNEVNNGLKDLSNLLSKMAQPMVKHKQFNFITFSLDQQCTLVDSV